MQRVFHAAGELSNTLLAADLKLDACRDRLHAADTVLDTLHAADLELDACRGTLYAACVKT
eukprot:1159519-Pelagomonas_calceolata.AAC.16